MKLELNQNNGKNFTVLKLSLKISEKLEPVIESIGRITGRAIDDLSSLLLIDQLLRYMKDMKKDWNLLRVQFEGNF